MNRTILLSLLLGLCIACNTLSADELHYPHYNMQVELAPESGTIQVKGELIIADNKGLTDGLHFYLDSALAISKFSLNKRFAFLRDSVLPDLSFMPCASRIVSREAVDYLEDLNRFEFSYSGRLSELPPYFANRMNTNWVELGLYYPWFPYSDEWPLFTYTLTVTIDDEYSVFGLGKTSKQEKQWIVDAGAPTNDMVLCASKDVQVKRSKIGSSSLSLYYHSMADSVVETIQQDLISVLTHLSSRFGEKAQNISIVFSKRARGGGYARMGGVFLGGFQPAQYHEGREDYFRYFAHELGHLWWFQADVNTWEDWLNEGFAEFAGLAVVRDVFGEEAFTERLNMKKQTLKETPEIWGFDRSNHAFDTIQIVLYNKAPVLLFALEEKIGRKRFQELCSDMLDKRVNSTQEMLYALEVWEGKEIASWFEEQLRSY